MSRKPHMPYTLDTQATTNVPSKTCQPSPTPSIPSTKNNWKKELELLRSEPPPRWTENGVRAIPKTREIKQAATMSESASASAAISKRWTLQKRILLRKANYLPSANSNRRDSLTRISIRTALALISRIVDLPQWTHRQCGFISLFEEEGSKPSSAT